MIGTNLFYSSCVNNSRTGQIGQARNQNGNPPVEEEERRDDLACRKTLEADAFELLKPFDLPSFGDRQPIQSSHRQQQHGEGNHSQHQLHQQQSIPGRLGNVQQQRHHQQCVKPPSLLGSPVMANNKQEKQLKSHQVFTSMLGTPLPHFNYASQ